MSQKKVRFKTADGRVVTFTRKSSSGGRRKLNAHQKYVRDHIGEYDHLSPTTAMKKVNADYRKKNKATSKRTSATKKRR